MYRNVAHGTHPSTSVHTVILLVLCNYSYGHQGPPVGSSVLRKSYFADGSRELFICSSEKTIIQPYTRVYREETNNIGPAKCI